VPKSKHGDNENTQLRVSNLVEKHNLEVTNYEGKITISWIQVLGV